jgi:hypothetical protein
MAATAHDIGLSSARPITIRSQSSVTQAPLGEAFDAVLVVRTATTDEITASHDDTTSVAHLTARRHTEASRQLPPTAACGRIQGPR